MLNSKYTEVKELGKGSFSTVYLAKRDNLFYAIKQINLLELKPQEINLLEAEKKILKVLKHPNIIKLYNIRTFNLSGVVQLVLEYCNGGTLKDCLYKYIEKYGKPFPEKLVQYFMKQILSALNYLHKNNIIHRDLKLDNIMIQYYTQEDLNNQNLYSSEIKLIDFNTSFFSNFKLPTTIVGIVPNMAPTIIKNIINSEEQSYDEKIDIWSLGTLCYEMLFGKPLFSGNQQTIQNIINGIFDIPDTISYEAKIFLYCMLQKNGYNRLSAEQLLNHDFIIKNCELFNKPGIYNSNDNIINTDSIINNYYETIYNNDNNINDDISNNDDDNNDISDNINNDDYSENMTDLNFQNETKKVNIFFKDEDGQSINLVVDSDMIMKDVLEMYFIKINKPELIDNYDDHIIFRYNSEDIKSKINSLAEEFENSIITIYYPHNI